MRRNPEEEPPIDWLNSPGHSGVEDGMACSDPDNQGVLHIAMGDIGGAAGTIFFQFVMAQILYAEAHKLTPFVHLNNLSYIVYDDAVHSGRQGNDGVRITGRVGRQATTIQRPGGHWRDAVPGPLDGSPERVQTLFLPGTGVWNHYFEPVSSYRPGDASCQNKSIVTLSLKHITPGLHGFASYAPKAWRYQYLPDYVTQPHLSMTEWLEPQRLSGIRVANQYLRLRPYLMTRAQRVNPNCSQQFMCLGLHIRHSDKASGRVRIETAEFLPYAQAFVHQGGGAIYLATDSSAVLEEVRQSWPRMVLDKLRTLDNLSGSGSDSSEQVLRSHDGTAVFDLHAHSHHATNQQVLVEIAALSSCQFLVHGLSAVSEAAIWMNSDGLYRRSVNLEDPERVGIAEFATLVQIVRRNESENRWPATSYRTDDWWNTSRYHEETKEQFGRQTIQDCSNYRGVLHVASVGYNSSAGPAFFTHVLNQLLYARNHQLLPWIHLDAASGAQSLFDDQYHKNADHASEILEIKRVPVRSNSPSAQYPYPGPPDASQSPHETSYSIQGNGVWESYFAPVASWTDVKACIGEGKSLFTLAPEQVSPGLDSYSADSVKAWRYDTVPDLMWPSTSDELKQLYERMRRTGHDLVKSYFRFRPYLLRRADRINPQSRSEAHRPCLGVHFRNGDKSGAHRRKVPLEKYLPYLQTFVEAGGEVLYVASDSHAILQYMEKVAPPDVWSKVRTQGNHVVRSAPNKKNPKATGWPSHMIGSHHRVNAETLVDVLGLSNCRWLVHTQSTVAEASIYLNMDLHNSSVNLEDTHKMTPLQFGDMIRADLKELRAKSVAAESLPVKSFSMRPLVTSHLDNATIIKRHRSVRGGCRTNAIVYLAQKRHSSYGRDSYAILQNSLKMLYRNYLSDPKHMNNTDLFIFHTGDFNQSDLVAVERSLGPSSRGAVHLVDLSRSGYWARPEANAKDDPTSWYAFPEFSEGYRRMMHWYAIDIWRFFRDYNTGSGCQYRYLFRLDEDSCIHSMISYDVFDFFATNRYVYGFRLCAYEMAVARRMWTQWKRNNPEFVPVRELDLSMCGFYNNLFVADLNFFTSPEVSRFLDFIDRQGHIYRRRLGDLMIHTMAVIAFAPPDRVHRFLDFTYEHGTFNKKDGCLVWGGIQAGYDDPNASYTMNEFYRSKVLHTNCTVNATFLSEQDLSPTYSHLPTDRKGRLLLHTLVRGWVETSAGKGLLSG